MLMIPEIFLGEHTKLLSVLKALPEKSGPGKSLFSDCTATYLNEVTNGREFLTSSDMVLAVCLSRFGWKNSVIWIKGFVSSETQRASKLLRSLGGSEKKGLKSPVISKAIKDGFENPCWNWVSPGDKLTVSDFPVPLWMSTLRPLPAGGEDLLDVRMNLIKVGGIVEGDLRGESSPLSTLVLPNGGEFFVQRTQVLLSVVGQALLKKLTEVKSVANEEIFRGIASDDSTEGVLALAPKITSDNFKQIKSLKWFSQALLEVMDSPDLHWMNLRESTEEYANSINWRKRPNHHERSVRRDVEFSRKLTLKFFKKAVRMSACSQLARVLSGEEVADITRTAEIIKNNWLDNPLEIANSSYISDGYYVRNIPDTLSNELRWMHLYKEVSKTISDKKVHLERSDKVSRFNESLRKKIHESLEVMGQSLDDRPRLVRSIRALIPVLHQLKKNGTDVSRSKALIVSLLSHVEGRDLIGLSLSNI